MKTRPELFKLSFTPEELEDLITARLAELASSPDSAPLLPQVHQVTPISSIDSLRLSWSSALSDCMSELLIG